jgi:hypothetical protein
MVQHESGNTGGRGMRRLAIFDQNGKLVKPRSWSVAFWFLVRKASITPAQSASIYGGEE